MDTTRLTTPRTLGELIVLARQAGDKRPPHLIAAEATADLAPYTTTTPHQQGTTT